MSRWSPYAAGALFVSAGVMHFAKPDFFESIMPDWVPNAKLANQLSGVTMHEPGVSRLVSVDVEEAAALAAV